MECRTHIRGNLNLLPGNFEFADQTVKLLLQHGSLDDPGDLRTVAEHVVLVQKLQGHLLARGVQIGPNDFRDLDEFLVDLVPANFLLKQNKAVVVA